MAVDPVRIHTKKTGRKEPEKRDSKWPRMQGATERERATRTLRDSEERFRATFEQAAVGIAHTTTDNRILEVNQKLCDILGYTAQELRQLKTRDLTLPEDRDTQDRLRQEVIAGERPYFQVEKRYVRKDGRTIWVNRTVTLARQAASGKPYLIQVFEDITERKELEQRYRETFDQAAVGIVHTSADGRYLRVNQKFCGMLGYSESELVGRPAADFTHSDDRDKSRQSRQLLWDGKLDKIVEEKRYIRKDGRVVWTNRTVSLARDASGKPDYFIRVIEDISERKQAEEAVARERVLLRTVVDTLPDHIYVKDIDGRYLLVNETGLRIRGVTTHEEVVGKAAADFVPAEVAKKFTEEDRWVVESGKPLVDREEKAASRGNIGEAGDVKWHLTTKVPLRDAGGKVVGIVGVNRDITEQKLSARRREMEHSVTRILSESATVAEAIPRLIRTMCEAMDWSYGAHWLWSDEEQNLVRAEYWSDFTLDFAGEDEEPWLRLRFRHPGGLLRRAWLRKEPTWIVDIDHEESFNRKRAALKFGLHSAFSFPVISGIETIGVVEFFGREVRQPDEMLLQISGSIGRQIGQFIQRKQAEDKVSQLAQFDTVTGLPNRYLVNDRLGQMLTQAQRNDWSVGVLFVDLDRFKAVNDTYGHAAGDMLLRQVAARLKECVRSGDTVGRLSGDEYAVVLSNLAKSDDAGLVAQKIVRALAAPFDLDGHQTYISASIGIALFPSDGGEPDTLIKNADTAMYRAKEQGRDGYQFYLPQMNERLTQRLQLEAQLRGALDRKEFLLHYQPKVSLATGAITGFEALLRWQRGERPVPPAEFISILEETGLIVLVGEWVLKSVCEQLKRWEQEGIAARPVAVNLSARQFQRKGLAAVVGQVLRENRVEPGLLELELTETLLMSEAEEAVETLHQLKSLGVRLAVDDFGTGYSSLTYLKRFPLDVLKIDRTFIRDAISNADDAAIVRTIIGLAHNMKLKVVAEGVETEGQLNFLRSHGCDEMQGFYFAHPLPVADCSQALREDLRLQYPQAGTAPESPSILLVDDNEDELLLLKRALSAEDFNILTANSTQAGFEILARNGADIVISDQRMPEMSGVDFLTSVRKLYPNTVRIIASSSDDAPTITGATNRAGIHKFLSKTWDADRLCAEVREAYQQRG